MKYTVFTNSYKKTIMMSRTISKLVLAIIMIAGTMVANAQNNTASDLSLKAQLMKMDGKLYLFITDEKDVPYSNKDITASAKIKYFEGKNQEATLKAFGETAFEFNESVSDFKQIIAKIRFKDGTQDLVITAKFNGKGVTEAMYECPMHPSEMDKAEGKCTKCGMSLMAKTVTTYVPTKNVRKGM